MEYYHESNNECNNHVQIQLLVNEYINADDVVLELWAGSGIVSCTINNKLNNKYNQISVEPNQKNWNSLEKNKKNNKCNFNIIKGFISNKKFNIINTGNGTMFVEDGDTNIQSITLDQVEDKYNLKFNVLVADCEGFLEIFFDENPQLYNELRLIIYEKDCKEKCNYEKIQNELKNNGFCLKKRLKQKYYIWIK
jgi:FkbM family methyltransferase